MALAPFPLPPLQHNSPLALRPTGQGCRGEGAGWKLGLRGRTATGASVPAEKVASEAAPLPPPQPLVDLPAGHGCSCFHDSLCQN